jgi:signal transduction histidine kinase/ActR/RegA family two-component response regulator
MNALPAPGTAPVAATASLIDASTGRRVEIGNEATIGRAPDCTMVIADAMVSQRHALLKKTGDGRYTITDLGSRNGTFVGSHKVREAILSDGDEVLIGPVRLRLEVTPSSGRRLSSAPRRREGGDTVRRREPEEPARAARPASVPPDLRRDAERMRMALALVRELTAEEDPTMIPERLLEAAFTTFNADRGTVILLDETGKPTMKVSRRRDGARGDATISTSIVSEVISKRRGVLSSNLEIERGTSRARSLALQNVEAVMCLPLLAYGELIGIVYLDSAGLENAFTDRDLDLLETVVAQAAISIKSAVLSRRVRDVVASDWQRIGRVVRALPDGIVLLDANRRMLMLNDRAAELLPLLSTARVGDVIDDLGSTTIDRVLEERGRRPTEVMVAGPPRRVLALFAWDCMAAPSALTEIVLVLHDVTIEREREQNSGQRERLALLGQLSGGIAHDFNNLLAVILNYTEFLRSDASAVAQEDLDQIRGAAERAAALTRQLLAFSRREVVTPKVFELDRLVTDMAKLLRRTLGEDIVLKMQFSAELPRVKADVSKIEQVLLNLVVNARDAMPEGGTLTILADVVTCDDAMAVSQGLTGERYAHLAVRDDGMGMPEDVRARVFEPFFTTKECGRGTGLGLATAYGVVKQAGGHIWVDSNPGDGTTFHVVLPETTEPGVEPASRQTTGGAGGTETILVVEDETGVRAAVRRMLTMAGYNVLEASHGAEALDVAARHPEKIPLLLTDLVMPGMSGKQLAEKLVLARPDTKVVFMSGYVDDGIVRQGILDPGVFFLAKPFTQSDLLKRVREAMGGDGVKRTA